MPTPTTTGTKPKTATTPHALVRMQQTAQVQNKIAHWNQQYGPLTVRTGFNDPELETQTNISAPNQWIGRVGCFDPDGIELVVTSNDADYTIMLTGLIGQCTTLFNRYGQKLGGTRLAA